MKKKKDGIRMLKYFKLAKTALLFMTFTTISTSVIGIFEPIVNARIIANMMSMTVDKALIFATILLFLLLLRTLLRHLDDIAYLKGINTKVFTGIRKDMIDAILSMKVKNFDKHESGEFIERLRFDPERISTILTVVQYSFISIITDLIILVYVFTLNIYIGIIYFIGTLISAIYVARASKKMEEKRKEGRKINDKTSSLLNEIMRGMRDIKFLNLGTRIRDLINGNLIHATEFDADIDVEFRSIYLKADVIQYITSFIVLLVGFMSVQNNLLSVANLIVIYMYRTNIYDAIYCYSSIKKYLVEYKVASKRIFELMDKNKYSKEKFGKKEITNIEGKIEIKKLSFGYDDKKILKDVNLKLKPKDTIGIVGASGSGKTTLLNLLVKGYDIPDGKIFIDDIDINKLSKDSLRSNISIINQHPYLFNFSIKENLKIIDESITDEEIYQACKISQIHNFIMNLPDKYDTLIGEGGISLSGGQRQRLAIARALLKKSKIILFDEATSALDNITQAELQKAINNISDDYTIIIVAHRLSTIKSCSKIYVMDDGKIVGSGTHDELLNNNKYYQELYTET